MHAIVPRGRNGDLQSVRDDELLHRFVAVRDQAAFEEIVRRHGPLVLSVCRQVLGHLQDAEDAFQATFLTLASRAGKIKRGVALPSWLHRVATRISRTLQRQNAKRQRNMTSHEHLSERLPAAEQRPDLKPMLDDELDRLPAKYRSAVLLCDYCGYSRKEAAASLDVPIGTLHTNLYRGRELLKKRLLRCGVAVSAVGVASALAKTASAAAPVSAELVHSTARLSLLFLAGRTATKPAAPAGAVYVAQSTIRRMTVMNLLSVSLLCVAVGTIAIAVPEIAQTNSVRAQPFFVDDFEDGTETDGNPVTWTFVGDGSSAVENGDYVLRTPGNGRKVAQSIVQESLDATNARLSARLRFQNAAGSFAAAGIYGRGTAPSFNSSYNATVFSDGRIGLSETNDSLELVRDLRVQTALRPSVDDIMLDLVVDGSEISVTAWAFGSPRPSQPQLSFVDTSLSSGPMGIFLDSDGASQVAFRSFASIPEPATAGIAAMALASLGGFVFLCRRRLD